MPAFEEGVAAHPDLMRRIAQQQDKEAFAILFSYYAPRVKSYLIKLGLDPVAADDTAQEVMVTLWHKAALFDPEKARLSTWLFRITRNKFIDGKRRRTFPEVDLSDMENQLVAKEETESTLLANQTAKQVNAAVKTLKSDHKRVIELSFFEELSHAEMAEKLDLPLGTVKSRIRLAFKALRKELAGLS
ncbi:sigma-70 family RNA polymerase sigma factor [Rhodovibrionaceae bacterium A322]